MPDYVVTRLAEELNGDGRALRGARILGVGLAYKRDIADDRESPARDVLERLVQRGAHVGVHDPFVAVERVAGSGFEVVADLAGSSGWDLAVVLTDHTTVDYRTLAERVPVVFDTRGVYRRLGLGRANVVAL